MSIQRLKTISTILVKAATTESKVIILKDASGLVKVAGACSTINNKFAIVLNENAMKKYSKSSVEFIILHEKGHIVNGDLSDKQSNTRLINEETNADLYAAKKLIKKYGEEKAFLIIEKAFNETLILTKGEKARKELKLRKKYLLG